MNNYHGFIHDDDFDRYDTLLREHLAGGGEAARFTAERLQLGIYSQRQEGLTMVRTKLPAGRLTPALLAGYAEVIEAGYSQRPDIYLTTRQDIQFHDVPLERTGELLRHLGRLGIPTREAGGNTVRNITTCPFAGLCPAERSDVAALAHQTAAYFLRHPLGQALPRKVKIALSGCERGCAPAAANDLTAIATHHEGRPGFRLLAGGGLGSVPTQPIELTPFVPEEDLLPAIEAVLVLHDRHSDRERKNRSRIKFLVARFGTEGFRERWAAELARTRSAFDPARAPRLSWREPSAAIPLQGRPRVPWPQRQEGRFAVPLLLPGGRIDAPQLRGLSGLLAAGGIDELRALPDQRLLVTGVPGAMVRPLIEGLAPLGLGLPQTGGDVVACPGSATCQLGITASERLRPLLSGGEGDLRIRINGCRNGCAQSDLADIGLYGKARRHFGQLVPTYGLQLGGGAGGFGIDGPELPATRVPEGVRRIEEAYRGEGGEEDFASWAHRKGAEWFAGLLRDLAQVSERALRDLLVDHGDSGLFQVRAIGTGECAGVKVDPIEKLRLDIGYERRLRDAFTAKRKFEEAMAGLERMLLLGARLVALRSGHRAAQYDPDAALALIEKSDDPLAMEGAALLHELRRWQESPDELSFAGLVERGEAWLREADGHRLTLRVTGT